MSKLLRIVSTALATSLIATGTATAAPLSDPVAIGPAPAPLPPLRLASDDSGLTAAWVGFQGDGYHVLVARKPRGGSWSTPVAVDPGTTTAADTLDLSVSPNGHAVVGWTVARGDSRVLRAATRSTAGSAWSSAKDVLPPVDFPSDRAEHHAFVASATGETIGLWDRAFSPLHPADPTPPSIRGTATLPAGATSWTTEPSTTGPSIDDTAVAIDDAGTAIAVGHNDAGDFASWVRPAGGTWQATGAPDDGGVSLGLRHRPSNVGLAVSPGGDAVATWTEPNFNFEYYDLVTARRPAGGTWGPSKSLAHVASSDLLGSGSVGIDAAGRATVVWSVTTRVFNGQGGASLTSDILAASAAGAGAWSALARLAPTLRDTVASYFPLPPPSSTYGASQVAVGRGGGTLALWQNPKFPNVISTAVRPAGVADWEAATEFSSAGLNPRKTPATDVDSAGTASVFTATETGVEVRTTSLGGDVTPPPPAITRKARISAVLVPFVKTCPATAAVNVSGTKATLPITSSGTGASLRCRVSGTVALPATTKVGTLLVAVVSAKGVLPSIRVVRATA